MTNVLIRDIPEATHARLVNQAEARGMSLQRFLANALTELAERATVADAVAHWESLARARDARTDLVWPSDDVVAGRDERARTIDAVTDVRVGR